MSDEDEQLIEDGFYQELNALITRYAGVLGPTETTPGENITVGELVVIDAVVCVNWAIMGNDDTWLSTYFKDVNRSMAAGMLYRSLTIVGG